MALVGGLTSFDVRIHDFIQLPLRFYDPVYLQFVGFDLLNFGVSIVEDCLLHYFMAFVISLSWCMKMMRYHEASIASNAVIGNNSNIVFESLHSMLMNHYKKLILSLSIQ